MQTSPSNWVLDAIKALSWPVVVFTAYGLGRYTAKVEARVIKVEKSISDLVSRHMPHIHNALLEIKTMLQARR